ncbi:ABC transporter ATP-binding protein [Candidatus Aerophobetes bacterium]|nr:ABC transporter ATP-binding protein [Candidatus Aerophobetes bacterium]
MPEILDVENLKTNFYTYEGVVKALEGVNFKINKGDTLGLVGETGCGKSVTSLSVMKLILPPGKIESGKVLFNLSKDSKPHYIDLLKQSEPFMQTVRGNEISMIFQEPSSALNPVYTVGEQIAESFLLHQKKYLHKEAAQKIEEELEDKKTFFLRRINLTFKKRICEIALNKSKLSLFKLITLFPFLIGYKRLIKKIAIDKSVNLLREMGVPNPEGAVSRYPHELSGGMQQRVVIAMALACRPKLLIADEPTSNLDVTIQAQILDLIRSLKKTMGASVLFISHDLGVVAEMCKWVAVMYAGSICELTTVKQLFENPLHPYTRALLRSVPKKDAKRLESIEGSVPNLVNPPSGCRFHPRCPKAREKCAQMRPEMEEAEENHLVACHFYRERD